MNIRDLKPFSWYMSTRDLLDRRDQQILCKTGEAIMCVSIHYHKAHFTHKACVGHSPNPAGTCFFLTPGDVEHLLLIQQYGGKRR